MKRDYDWALFGCDYNYKNVVFDKKKFPYNPVDTTNPTAMNTEYMVHRTTACALFSLRSENF